ncbi:shikimate dehydrogenase [Sphingomonas sp. Leaf231]|uniref:shikimate 5-dehydrogenase n=1 Tax=Sphingomonas sp. Leaf231 TaxID=1736301 RepID=UPI0007008EED|nr:shikimate 5-dehydrogenase [Sphingomonas sp. Leaf231]KQN94137.1 shikimate dehydrogenase [Sphingomonas sp. Leaf231]
MKPPIGPATRLCMSLAARPGTFGSRFQNHLYDALGLDYVYKAFTTTDLAGAVTGIRALGIRGCAVSMPFKEAVIPMLDGLRDSAAAIDSVNTIVNDDGVLLGYNTDYSAVRDLIEPLPRVPFLLRGSGGMAKAVATALVDAGFAQGTIAARNEGAGRTLAEKLGCRWQAEADGEAALLVNVTPLGMTGADQDALAFTREQIGAARLVMDVVARPVETPLLRAARDAGKQIVTGAAIATLQGLEQFVLYTGIRPTAAQVAAAEAHALG